MQFFSYINAATTNGKGEIDTLSITKVNDGVTHHM